MLILNLISAYYFAVKKSIGKRRPVLYRYELPIKDGAKSSAANQSKTRLLRCARNDGILQFLKINF